ncbi:MAG: glucose 1-dehydrogenase [Chloroflexi bacterium]|nr:glucose 1-dehydrogenase [Chloroflexota bacterium]
MSTADFSLLGKIAIVTGGSRGLGRAITLGYAEAGADVVIVSRNADAGERVAQEIRGRGRQALALAADVSKCADVARMVEKTLEAFGKIDVLVNNAGISPTYQRAELVTEEDWDAIINTDLKGVFLCAQAVGKVMIQQKKGKIVNIASIGGIVALTRLLPYCAAKGGVIQITKVLAVEWAEHNIQVNALAPGFLATDMTKDIAQIPRFYEPLIAQTPQKRFGHPQEIVGAAIYLASEASNFMTGQTIIIDGGLTAA